MSTTPRLPSADPSQPPSFHTILAHRPALLASFRHAYGTFWRHGVLDQATKEVARMRNARLTDCGFCRNVRFAGAREQGLEEEDVAAIDEGYAASHLCARHKLAVRYADAFLEVQGIDDELRAALDAELTAEEQEELGIGMALFHGFAKILIALGCEPDQMVTTVLPTPDVPASTSA